MKILKLLNKKSLSIILIFFFLFSLKVYPEEPVDIWNVDLKKIIIENSNKEKVKKKTNSTNTVYEMQSQKQNELEIEQDKKLFSQKINIAGLYDPEENDLTIDMW